MVSLLGVGGRVASPRLLSAGSWPSWKERLECAVSCSSKKYTTLSQPHWQICNNRILQCQNPEYTSLLFQIPLEDELRSVPRWELKMKRHLGSLSFWPRSEGTPDCYLKCCTTNSPPAPRLLTDNMKWLGCPYPLKWVGPGNGPAPGGEWKGCHPGALLQYPWQAALNTSSTGLKSPCLLREWLTWPPQLTKHISWYSGVTSCFIYGFPLASGGCCLVDC